MADCWNHLGLVLGKTGTTDESRQAFQNAIQLQEEIRDLAPNKDQVLSDLAMTRSNLGTLYRETGNLAGATGAFGQALQIQEQLLAAAPTNSDLLRSLSATLNGLGLLYVDAHPEKSIPYYERAADLLKKAADLENGDPLYRGDLAVTYNNLGRAQSIAGNSADAADSYAKAIEMQTEAVRGAPAKKSNRGFLAIGYNNLGLEQAKHNDSTGAEASFRHALELQETLVKENSHDVELRSTLGGMYNNLGFVLEGVKRPTDALAAYGQAVEHQRQAMSQSPDTTRFRVFLSRHYINYARMLLQAGRVDEALEASLARRNLWPSDPNQLFSVAEELAVAADNHMIKSRHGPIAADYSDRAVETLKQAISAGWKPSPNTNWTKSFTAIKNRPDFLALIF